MAYQQLNDQSQLESPNYEAIQNTVPSLPISDVGSRELVEMFLDWIDELPNRLRDNNALGVGS